MNIIEKNVTAKSPAKKSEDGIVATSDFIAVIDGSTSKTDRRYSLFSSNGRYAMHIIAKHISKMRGDTSCHQFCLGVSKAIARHYPKASWQRLAEHPEERLTASCIVFSRLRREIWMVGDCQCLITPAGGRPDTASASQYYDNPKPYEQQLAEERAAIIRGSKQPSGQFLIHDTAREAIIPHMLEAMKEQNKSYAVIDGFTIPEQHVPIITLDFQPWEIVLASDGYPFLCPTLSESEELLQRQRCHDPLNIGKYKATKAFMVGNNSFDDRSFIRFQA